jgi:DNA-directed RNA polymerase subunit M/transcription elongation factor TFIIS
MSEKKYSQLIDTVVKKSIVERIDDDDIALILRVDRENLDGLIYCRRCKTSKYTRYVHKQMRSADEGMTAIVECDKCGKKFKQ